MAEKAARTRSGSRRTARRRLARLVPAALALAFLLVDWSNAQNQIAPPSQVRIPVATAPDENKTDDDAEKPKTESKAKAKKKSNAKKKSKSEDKAKNEQKASDVLPGSPDVQGGGKAKNADKDNSGSQSEDDSSSSPSRYGMKAGSEAKAAAESDGADGAAAGGGGEVDRSPIPPKVTEPAPAPENEREGVDFKYPLSVFFKDGLEFETKNKLFVLRIHDETQLDGRAFSHVAPGNSNPRLHDTFNLPRQRLMFVGNLSPYVNYNVTLQAGVVGSFNIVNVYADLGPQGEARKKFRLRIGRFKVPYSYEWYNVHNWQLVGPERPLFVANYTPNRQLGVMAHGRILGNTLQYAAGIFNGPAKSLNDYDNSKDLAFYLDWTPFINTDIRLLENLHFAGSFVNGNQNNTPNQPDALRTANQGPAGSANDTISPTFLKFKDNVVLNGVRRLWAADVYWFYGSFNLFLNYSGGEFPYAHGSGGSVTPSSAMPNTGPAGPATQVPLSGYSVTASYFLTGEQLTERAIVRPLHPMIGRGPGWGAFEPYARFSNLNVGGQVFTGGFADPSKYANRANTVDAGMNWYMNQWIRIVFEWQRSMFNRPVDFGGGKIANTNDLYWMRFQLFY